MTTRTDFDFDVISGPAEPVRRAPETLAAPKRREDKDETPQATPATPPPK
jgi:hypothetical protein